MIEARQKSAMLNRVSLWLRAVPSRMTAPMGVAFAAFTTVGASALALVASIPFTDPFPLVTACAVFGGPAGVALSQVRAHHPYSRFGLANSVTLVRLGGVAVFAALAMEPALVSGASTWIALAAAIVVLCLDGIDGWLARRERLASVFGARFDMEVDALLILVLAALCIALGAAGPWILGLGLARYAFVAAGWVWPWLTKPLPPSYRRKAICVLQVTVLIVFLAPTVGAPLANALGAVALGSLIWSFGVDVLWLFNRRFS